MGVEYGGDIRRTQHGGSRQERLRFVLTISSLKDVFSRMNSQQAAEKLTPAHVARDLERGGSDAALDQRSFFVVSRRICGCRAKAASLPPHSK